MVKSPLQRFVERASKDPFFLGNLLSAYQESRGWDKEALATFLGCDLLALDRLASCRAPSSQPPMFQDEVRTIAAFGRCSAEKLAILVRETTVVQTVRGAGDATHQGYLLAARDRKTHQTRKTGKKHGPKRDGD